MAANPKPRFVETGGFVFRDTVVADADDESAREIEGASSDMIREYHDYDLFLNDELQTTL
jgi:hypothetical protein